MQDIILSEKYVTKLAKESALSIGGSMESLQGGLILTNEGVIFLVGNTFLASYNNQGKENIPGKKLILTFNDIVNVELGSFKNLWKMMYTVRIYLKNGEKFSFLMTNKETADKWIMEIKRLMK